MLLNPWDRSIKLTELEEGGYGYKIDSKTFCTNQPNNVLAIKEYFSKFENTIVWLNIGEMNNYEVMIEIES